MQKVVSIIPIKLDNERLPGKNTMPLGNVPLMQYCQRSLIEAADIDERYVFCSDESVKGYMLPEITFLKRNPGLDLPAANFTQIFESFFNIIHAGIYVYAHATAPFITPDTINECVRAVKSGEYDSAFCAEKIQDYLWLNGEPLNFNAQNLPRSQDIEPVYRETSGIYVFTRDVFKLYNRRIGQRPFIKELGFKEAIDINTREDFRLAEIMLNADLQYSENT